MSTDFTTGTRVLRTSPTVVGGSPSPADVNSCSPSAVDPDSPVDMFEPVLVLVDLAPHGGEIGLLHGLGDGPGRGDLAVVDRANGHDLGGGAGEEGLLGQVEVGAQEVGLGHLIALVAG